MPETYDGTDLIPQVAGAMFRTAMGHSIDGEDTATRNHWEEIAAAGLAELRRHATLCSRDLDHGRG